ncbi:MAG TPA: DNA-processing protein DprA, partial [Gammaproteobacteria bacterium]|nr:DNA-processing protein DprA [Gammaproteobacteria bacterium]
MHLLKPDIAYWVAATRLSGVGPLTLRRWLDLFGDIKILFSISAVELKKAGLSEKQLHALKNVDWRNVESDLRWSEKNRCEIISLVDPRYPRLLREIPDAPSLLYVRGDVNLLSQSQLAIVGSRNPTAVGNQMAEDFAYSLTKAGLVVTSGLALGIDAASHRGALRATGKTIAVFGTGLKHIYPRSHRSLAEDIAEQGALVSEFPPDESPKAKNFPRRNRIISGLSIGVLVVEAVLRSGSLITARYAVEQGRDVFAIPGSIHNPLARGCHALIRQGAKLVETAEDIVEELDALHTLLKQKNDFLPA